MKISKACKDRLKKLQKKWYGLVEGARAMPAVEKLRRAWRNATGAIRTKFLSAKRWQQIALLTACGVLVLCAQVGILILGLSGQYNITAEAGSFYGTGTFALHGVSGMDAEYLEANLSISPQKFLSVTKPGEDTAVVTVKGFREEPYTVALADSGGDAVFTLELGADTLFVELTSPSNAGRVSDSQRVVLTFSQTVDEEALRQSLWIEPAASISIRCDGNNAIIYPDRSWDPGTRYTITLDEEYALARGKQKLNKTSFAIHTAAVPSTPSLKVQFHDLRKHTWQADEYFELEFACENVSGNLPVIVHTWRVDTMEKYMEQREIYVDYPVDLSVILEKADSNAYLLHNDSNTLRVKNPGMGAYILEAVYENPVTGESVSMRAAVMVSDVTAYIQTTQGHTLIWLNRYGTGTPLAGYTVSFVDKTGELCSAVTDQSGVCAVEYAVEDYRDQTTATVQIAEPEGEIVYVDSTNVLGGYSYNHDRYYSYFYLDRPLYKPTDLISFWGFVKPYHGNKNELPDSVFVVFDPEGLNMELEIPLDPAGTFTGEIPLEKIRSSQYHIVAQLRIPELAEEAEEPGEEAQGAQRTAAATETAAEAEETAFSVHQLDSAYVDVKEYEKPTYVISSSLDQAWYTADQQITATITPSFYDGTPLPNYDLEFSVFDYDSYSWASPQIITTDEWGVATATFPANRKRTSAMGWALQTNRYMVQIASDGENITLVDGYTYFPSSIMSTGELTQNDDGAMRLEVRANQLDFAALTDEQLQSEPANRQALYDSLKGAGVENAEVEVEFNWYRYGKTNYAYNRSGTVKTTGTLQNGVLVLEDLTELDEEVNQDWIISRSVHARFTMSDPQGNTISDNASYFDRDWEYYQNYYGEEGTVQGYSMAVYNSAGEDVTGPYYAYLPYNMVSFGDGESFRMELCYNGEPVENTGKLLYTLIQDDVIEQDIIGGTTLQFTQQIKYAGSVNIVVAYFDGRDICVVRDTVVYFDQESSVLKLEVTTDKEAYTPGDTMSLQVRATDANGSGVAASVCVGVVDEAVFALREQYVNVQSSLFGDLYFYNHIVKKYSSKTGDYDATGGADEGKGDPDSLAFYDSYRKNFKDTAAFLPLRTNAGGFASVQFQLPDNITSWRITTVGVGDNLYAGQSKDNVISSLPFFISPVISSKYIAGDDVAMLVQGHGTLLDSQSDIDYAVHITGNDVDRTLNETGKAYQAAQVNFGALPEGDYTVVATARYSGYSDTVELPLSVIRSNLELVIHKELDLQGPLNVEAVRYPVVITVYDKENDPFFSSLSSLFGHYCMQASQRMSRFAAKRALSQRMDASDIPGYIKEGNDSATEMQNEDGGIGYSMGENSDPVLTAQLALVAPDQYDPALMTKYFNGILELSYRNPIERAAAYMGLAACGEPVEEEILRFLGEEPELEVQAYLIAGLGCVQGSEQTALAQYNRRLGPKLETNKAHSENADKQREIAAIWIAASVLRHEDADFISLYFAENTWRIGTLFECMIYVAHYDKEVIPHTLTYSVGGQTHSVDLGVRGSVTLKFSQSEFQSLAFQDVSPDLMGVAYYIGEPSEIDIQPSENMSVSKTITAAGDGDYRISITIKFDNNAPTGQYDVSDWIPSSMRLYKMNTLPDYTGYTTEGQKIYFKVYRHTGRDRVTITYLARKTFDAAAVMDSTYVIHGDTGENCQTDRYTLTS